MSTRTQYKTRQREALFTYFASIPGQHFTVNDVCAYFHAQGCPIGMTTVYRQLDRMVDEGLVNKYIIDANTPACYEYIGEASHCTEETCFHCKCEKCGALIHLHCEELESIQAHLMEHHHFVLNPLRTVFYGLCEKCASGTSQTPVRIHA